MFDDISIPCGGLKFDEVASFAFGFDCIAFAVLDGRVSDAGAGNTAFSATLGLDGNRIGFPLAPIGGDNKVPARNEALE